MQATGFHTIPSVSGPIYNFVALNNTIGRGKGWRHPAHTNRLGGKCGASGVSGRHLWLAFSGVLANFLRHRTSSNLVKGLNNN